MHELSIVQALIEQVESEIEKSGETGPVVALELAIGRLSGVHVDSIRFGYEFLSPGTVLEGAELRISEPRASITCRACGHREPISELVMRCPKCDSGEIVVEGGRELLLQSIELDD